MTKGEGGCLEAHGETTQGHGTVVEVKESPSGSPLDTEMVKKQN